MSNRYKEFLHGDIKDVYIEKPFGSEKEDS